MEVGGGELLVMMAAHDSGIVHLTNSVKHLLFVQQAL